MFTSLKFIGVKMVTNIKNKWLWNKIIDDGMAEEKLRKLRKRRPRRTKAEVKELDEKAVALRRLGWTYAQIKDQLKIADGQLHRALTKAGLIRNYKARRKTRIRKKRITEEDIKKIREAYANGYTAAYIAQKTGVSPQSVHRFIKADYKHTPNFKGKDKLEVLYYKYKEEIEELTRKMELIKVVLVELSEVK